MFDLFFLDYFVTFSVGFRLSVPLELTQNLRIRNCWKTWVDKCCEGQFGHIRYWELDFL